MNYTEASLNDDITKSNRQIFPTRLVNKYDLFNNLYIDLKKTKQEQSRNKLVSILYKNNKDKLRNYSKKVFDIVFKNKQLNSPEVQKGMKLFQTAFLEMEGLFGNIARMQKGKTGFDHLLGVLDNILKSDNPSIDECIIAMLHDSVEEINGYTISHIKKLYGIFIASSINNLTKEARDHYIIDKTNKIQSITKKIRNSLYYNDMISRGQAELEVKFADRIDSLETMDGLDKEYLQKKLIETNNFFLIPELKMKVSKFKYNKLENIYKQLILQ